VEAVPVDLDGAHLMALSDGQKAHIVSRDTFELMFRAHEPAEPPVAAAPEPSAPKLKQLKRANPKRLAKAAATRPVVGATTKEFDAYPLELRDPRGFAIRAVYDALVQGPAPLVELVKRCKAVGWQEAESGRVMGLLIRLRDKRLAKKQDAMMGGDWTLV
jgi:hypothetical protein